MEKSRQMELDLVTTEDIRKQMFEFIKEAAEYTPLNMYKVVEGVGLNPATHGYIYLAKHCLSKAQTYMWIARIAGARKTARYVKINKGKIKWNQDEIPKGSILGRNE